MADRDDGGGSLTPYPNPPTYLWSQFTEDNATRLQGFRETHRERVSTPLTVASILPDVPEELASLQPPPVPPSGRWRVFGQLYDLSDRLPTLEDQGVARLGPPPSATGAGGETAEKDAHAAKVFELRKLAKSLLLNFLELAGVLGANPAEAAAKLADLQTIFYNMHQHINEWRPHQTREALIALLQSQLEQTRNETRALHEATDGVRKTLVGLARAGKEGGDAQALAKLLETRAAHSSRAEEAEDAERRRYDELWNVLDSTFR